MRIVKQVAQGNLVIGPYSRLGFRGLSGYASEGMIEWPLGGILHLPSLSKNTPSSVGIIEFFC